MIPMEAPVYTAVVLIATMCIPVSLTQMAPYALIGRIPPSEPVVLTVDRPLPWGVGADPVQSPPPPGCAPEGVWAHEQYCGPNTCVIAFVIFPCICFCPQDTRRVYMLHGKKYDANGQLLNSTQILNSIRFN